MLHTPWLSCLIREDRGMPAWGSTPHSLSMIGKDAGWFPAGHPTPLASRLLDCPYSFRPSRRHPGWAVRFGLSGICHLQFQLLLSVLSSPDDTHTNARHPYIFRFFGKLLDFMHTNHCIIAEESALFPAYIPGMLSRILLLPSQRSS